MNLLNHKDLRSYARQALFHFPKLKEEQQTLVRQLDALRAETKKLEAIYQQKLLILKN